MHTETIPRIQLIQTTMQRDVTFRLGLDFFFKPEKKTPRQTNGENNDQKSTFLL